LNGNLLVAQSGGPTAVINASVAGVVIEARKRDCIKNIYGGANGILGILNETIIDLGKEDPETIQGLRYTPAAALGTCRYKIDFKKKPEQAARDMDRLFDIFKAHDIRYFFYIGGNDSQDTADKVALEAVKRGYDMRVIGVPKTIDNDLPHTDHCPGFGSVAKYNATSVMEIATDIRSMATDDGSCCIVELMGRGAGWIAASTVLAKRQADDAPHIILLPEIAFDEAKFLEKVRETVTRLRYCIVVVGEGLKNADGSEYSADKNRLDAFGHPVLSGAADRLVELVTGKLNIKARSVKLGYAQRCAEHYASAVDSAEAFACGGHRSGQGQKRVHGENRPHFHPTLQVGDRAATARRYCQRGEFHSQGLAQRGRLHAKRKICGVCPSADRRRSESACERRTSPFRDIEKGTSGKETPRTSQVNRSIGAA
jgi:6-phosphofructokinase 1